MSKDVFRDDALPDRLSDILARVTRPGRYVGGEFNLRRKPAARPRIVLSYPDVYEVGIANPGLQILYALLNDGTSAAAERAYCPWPDMATLMRERGSPLWTLESFAPVREAELWGFTLQHELTYTNVLEMLDLAGVPLFAVERGADDPVVMGGGPCTADPLPMSRFFDAFFVGEAEGRVGEIVEALGAPTRAGRLDRLARVPGVWLPDRAGGRARRQVFTGFSSTPPPGAPLVPLLEAVHDRATVEVMRGCTAGCRFCHAGSWYRPVRERPPEMVVETALAALRSTGCDEVSLFSLSSCDYSGIERAVTGIRAAAPDVRVSLPSLRVDSAAVTLSRLGGGHRGTVTLAPEAGSQRLRDVINKRVAEKEFDEAVRAVFAAGFSGLKLYFMIGLPHEDEADAAAIADLATAAWRHARGAGSRARVGISVSTFVPKAQTPFEREAFAGETAVAGRQALVRGLLPRGVKAAFHDIGASLVEASLATAGAEAGALVEAAWRGGARFDGWSEGFDLAVWRRAAAETGVELGRPAGDGSVEPPWRTVVDGLIDPEFLDRESRRASRGETTGDCRRGPCAECGVCEDGIAVELAG